MVSDKHRCFYVNGKLEFAVFFDASVRDKKKIIDDFLKTKDFQNLSVYCKWKVKSTKISKDLKRVDIDVIKEK